MRQLVSLRQMIIATYITLTHFISSPLTIITVHVSYVHCRWVGGGWPAIQKAEVDGKLFGVNVVQDRWNRPVLLFRNPWKVSQLTTEEEYLKLEPWAMPPAIIESSRKY